MLNIKQLDDHADKLRTGKKRVYRESENSKSHDLSADKSGTSTANENNTQESD